MLSCEYYVTIIHIVSTLATSVQHYLRQTLGISVSRYQQWPRSDELPYFLRDAFDFWEMDLLGRKVLVAMDLNPDQSPISEIRLRLNKVNSVSGNPVIYVTDALASYERKRLIEQKIPFIVPGNQLYLPDLGIDLREYFRQRPSSAQSPLSPSAQAMLITALLRPNWESDWHPSEVATTLCYTPMTISRTVRELTAAGIASVRKAGRSQYLSMEFSPRETWERVRPMLRSPIQRTIWMPDISPNIPRRLAGLSALAHHSMLVEPKQPVYAFNRAQWNAHNQNLEISRPMTGYLECQLWNYSPALQRDSNTVDPLSLMLSLQDSNDERVQSALDELKGQLPW
jgi:hypothetical protein